MLAVLSKPSARLNNEWISTKAPARSCAGAFSFLSRRGIRTLIVDDAHSELVQLGNSYETAERY